MNTSYGEQIMNDVVSKMEGTLMKAIIISKPPVSLKNRALNKMKHIDNLFSGITEWFTKSYCGDTRDGEVMSSMKVEVIEALIQVENLINEIYNKNWQK